MLNNFGSSFFFVERRELEVKLLYILVFIVRMPRLCLHKNLYVRTELTNASAAKSKCKEPVTALAIMLAPFIERSLARLHQHSLRGVVARRYDMRSLR